MRNKILLSLIILSFLLGIFFVLNMMYGIVDHIDYSIGDDTTNVEYAGQLYFLTAIIMSLFIFFIKEISLVSKQIVIVLVTIFYIFSLILALITFYSNPNNQVEVMAGVFFFLAGSLFLASSFFIKDLSEINKIENIGAIHKTIRYILVIIVCLTILKIIIGLVHILPLLSL